MANRITKQLCLSVEQKASLRAIADGLLPGSEAKARFVHDVAAALDGYKSPSDLVVRRAIDSVLSTNNTTTSAFLCDSTSTTKEKTMTTTNNNKRVKRLSWDDPNAWGPDGILKDGVCVSLPVSLADAKMGEVYQAARAMNDGRFNRPGWRPALHQDAAVADARQKVRDEYQNYENYITSAYRQNDADRDRDDRGASGWGERGTPNQQLTGPIGGDEPDDRDEDVEGFGERGQRGLMVEGATCTCKGSGDLGAEGDAGIVRRVGGKLVCVSNRNAGDARDGSTSHKQVMDEAYARYDSELRASYLTK